MDLIERLNNFPTYKKMGISIQDKKKNFFIQNKVRLVA